ncbi:MAG: acyl-CoA thioesterase/BAAT N-terminal domain-containing protein [Acidothermaceae bacterium]
MDSAVAVSISGLPPHALTTVTASVLDEEHDNWSSSATFDASSAGTVSTTQSPTSGSYTGANPMGLFETLAPTPGEDVAGFAEGRGGFVVKLTARVGAKIVATAYATRQTSRQPRFWPVSQASMPTTSWCGASRAAARPRCCSAPTSRN